MPWYLNPDKTLKLLDRFAQRQPDLQALRQTLDTLINRIWIKSVEYSTHRRN